VKKGGFKRILTKNGDFGIKPTGSLEPKALEPGQLLKPTSSPLHSEEPVEIVL